MYCMLCTWQFMIFAYFRNIFAIFSHFDWNVKVHESDATCVRFHHCWLVYFMRVVFSSDFLLQPNVYRIFRECILWFRFQFICYFFFWFVRRTIFMFRPHILFMDILFRFNFRQSHLNKKCVILVRACGCASAAARSPNQNSFFFFYFILCYFRFDFNLSSIYWRQQNAS